MRFFYKNLWWEPKDNAIYLYLNNKTIVARCGQSWESVGEEKYKRVDFGSENRANAFSKK